MGENKDEERSGGNLGKAGSKRGKEWAENGKSGKGARRGAYVNFFLVVFRKSVHFSFHVFPAHTSKHTQIQKDL